MTAAPTDAPATLTPGVVHYWPAALGLIVLLSAIPRFAQITRDCLWFDEIWHITLSSGRGSAQLRIPTDTLVAPLPDYVRIDSASGWTQIPRNMDLVLHLPAYHLLLRGWREMLGDSPLAVRGLSAILSVLAVLVAFDVGRLVMNTVGGGLWAAALLAASPGQIEQAQEARGYTLLLLLGLIATSALLRAARDPRSIAWPVLVAVTLMVMMFTHYFAAGYCAGVLASVWLIRGNRARAIVLAGFGVLATVWLMTWWPTLREQSRAVAETADPWLTDAGPGFVGREVLRLAALPARALLNAPVGVVSAAIGIGLWAMIIYASSRCMRSWAVVLPFAGTVGLLVGLDLLRSTRHTEFLRYALVASPAVVIGLVAATRALLGSGRRLYFARGLVLTGLVIALPWWGYARQNQDFRPLCAYLAQQVKPDEPIVLLSPNPLGRDGQTLYLYLAYYTDLFPRPAAVATRVIDGNLAQSLRQNRRVWVVSANPMVDAGRVWPDVTVVESVRFNPVGAALCVEPPK